MKIPRTLEERNKLLGEIAKRALRDAFEAGWVAGQFSVLQDDPQAIEKVVDDLNRHECDAAFSVWAGVDGI